MEGSDVFAQEITGSDDPFAGTDLDDAFGAEPEASPASENGQGGQSPALPVVNREGERLGGAFTDTPPESLEAVAVAPEATEATPDPTPPPAQAGPTEGATESTDPPFAEAGTTPSASGPPPTTPQPGEATPDPTPAAASADVPAVATGPSAGESSSTPESSAPAEEEEAPPPDETKDKNNRVTKRRYLIFRVDAPGKLTQVHWYEKGGKLTERGTQGARRQTVYLSRGTDDALKFGYIASGQPRGGIKLVAVAALHFQPKEVKPLPPEPSKTRLQIN